MNTIPLKLDPTDKEKYETDKPFDFRAFFMARYIWALPPKGIAQYNPN